MAIIPSGIWPIDPTITNGTELAQYLNDWVQAFSSQHANATRPPMIARGGVWAKTLGATDIALMLYDGTTDYEIGKIIGGNASFGGGTNAGTTAPASPAVGDMWYDTGASQLKIYDGANWNPVDTKLNPAPITLDAVNNRVGINQATPTKALDVTGDVSVTGDILCGTDGAGDLGAASNRFKDLYLGGGVVFGTGGPAPITSNTLDDYEEGTCILKFGDAGFKVNSNAGYVKIGALVYVSLQIYNLDMSATTGPFKLFDLPFVASASGAHNGVVSYTSAGNPAGPIAVTAGTTEGHFYKAPSTSAINFDAISKAEWAASGYQVSIFGTIVYTTDA